MAKIKFVNIFKRLNCWNIYHIMYFVEVKDIMSLRVENHCIIFFGLCVLKQLERISWFKLNIFV
jgi:hypothetical protein